jgi:hypothetical protein
MNSKAHAPEVEKVAPKDSQTFDTSSADRANADATFEQLFRTTYVTSFFAALKKVGIEPQTADSNSTPILCPQWCDLEVIQRAALNVMNKQHGTVPHKRRKRKS